MVRARSNSRAVAAAVVFVLAALACALVPQAARAYGSNGSGVTERDWGTCASAVAAPARTWYLAEGCTEPGFETWVLVQNPGDEAANIAMDLQTDKGPVTGPRARVPARSRATFNLADSVVSFNVSTRVISDRDIVCERSMYGNNREWATGATGVTAPAKTWYLAEGCTDGGLETWVLVQNPGTSSVDIEMTLQGASGEVPGPRKTIPAGTRRTYNVADYLVAYDVSIKVKATGGVVCERAMYGNGREWGTDDTGIPAPSKTWYLAEGCTLPGFETWLLVQNPGPTQADIKMSLLSDKGEKEGPTRPVPPMSRNTYNLGDIASGISPGTVITSSVPIVVERAMYGDGRLWGTCASGVRSLSKTWYLAEGCTQQGFETWVEVMNPSRESIDVTVKLLTESGEVDGPSGSIAPRSRKTFKLDDYVTSYNVSAVVEASAPVACERSMYGEGTNRRLCAPVPGPPLYPLTKDGSIACGHWSAGSTDYPYFGAPRNGTRLHAGVDIYPPGGEGTPVRAVKPGTVVTTGTFYTRANGEQTYAILVDHGDFVADYGEVKKPESWVVPGATVERGQVIGYVSGTVQLHFEMYAPGTTSWLQWYGPQPANLIDPTSYMLMLY
jgi:hypothetical protein